MHPIASTNSTELACHERTRPPTARETVVSLVLMIATSLIIAPISAMIVGSFAQTIWTWFLQAEYGAGPTITAWYGISCFFAIATSGIVARLPQSPEVQKDPKYNVKHPIRVIVGLHLNYWMFAAIVVVIAWGVKAALPWIA